jgi:signal peptidase I
MKLFFKNNRGFIAFLLCFGVFRLAIADWNPVPSGSMRPTILEGDVVLINRLAYDVKLPLSDTAIYQTGNPQRGGHHHLHVAAGWCAFDQTPGGLAR